MSTDLAVRQSELPTAADMNAAALYAERLAHSGLLPAQYRKQPANVLYAIEYGRMIGLAPMAAITGVHVIEGKPTASAALISALVRRAGHKLRVSGNAKSATAQIVRSDDPDYVFEVTWTIEDARAANLAGKAVWKQYPASMLKARAITQCARDACEEALLGMHYTPEELGAEVDEDGVPVVVEQVPEDAPTPAPLREPTPHRPKGAERSHGPREDEWTQPAPAADGIEDAEVVEEPRGISDGQLTAVHTLIAQKYGPKTDEERHASFTRFTKREITSAKQLTYAEASAYLDVLSKQPDFVKPEPETGASVPNPREDPYIAPSVAHALTHTEADVRAAREAAGPDSPAVEYEELLRDRLEAAQSLAEVDAVREPLGKALKEGQIDQAQHKQLRELYVHRRGIYAATDAADRGWSAPVSRAMDEAAA